MDCPYVKYDGATWFGYDHFYCGLCQKKVTEAEAKLQDLIKKRKAMIKGCSE